MVHLLTWVWPSVYSLPGAYSFGYMNASGNGLRLNQRFHLKLQPFNFLSSYITQILRTHSRWFEPVCNKPLVAYPSLAWCLERKIPVGRRPFSQAGRRRSSFSGDEEQSPPPYHAQGPTRPRPRTHLHQIHKSGNLTLTIKPARHLGGVFNWWPSSESHT